MLTGQSYVLCTLPVLLVMWMRAMRHNAIIYIDTIELQPFCYNATYITGILLMNIKRKICSGKG
jgi:hypothetical protein